MLVCGRVVDAQAPTAPHLGQSFSRLQGVIGRRACLLALPERSELVAWNGAVVLIAATARQVLLVFSDDEVANQLFENRTCATTPLLASAMQGTRLPKTFLTSSCR